jgi:hypothetical protein
MFAFTQCDRIGNEVYIPDPGQEEPEIPVVEPPQMPETPETPESPHTNEEIYEQMDAIFDREYDSEAACLSPAKTGKINDIVGKWKLVWDINRYDVTSTNNRSCEDIVYHFREDGILTVSNRPEEDVTYKYSLYPACPTCSSDDFLPNLRMGDSTHFCEVRYRWMTLYPHCYYIDEALTFSNNFMSLFLRIE